MRQITCWLDFISPYAYLAFEKLPEALQGLSYSMRYKPVLFAGLLKHHGQLGPAEIPGKRDWTYRQVLWLAHSQGRAHADARGAPVSTHSRCCAWRWACGDASGEVNRYVCETVLRHVWRGGADAADPARLHALAALLQPAQDPGSDAVKALLKSNTDEAIARGLFGVPTFSVDDKLFWGFDALPMLRAIPQR